MTNAKTPNKEVMEARREFLKNTPIRTGLAALLNNFSYGRNKEEIMKHMSEIEYMTSEFMADIIEESVFDGLRQRGDFEKMSIEQFLQISLQFWVKEQPVTHSFFDHFEDFVFYGKSGDYSFKFAENEIKVRGKREQIIVKSSFGHPGMKKTSVYCLATGNLLKEDHGFSGGVIEYQWEEVEFAPGTYVNTALIRNDEQVVNCSLAHFSRNMVNYHRRDGDLTFLRNPKTQTVTAIHQGKNIVETLKPDGRMVHRVSQQEMHFLDEPGPWKPYFCPENIHQNLAIPVICNERWIIDETTLLPTNYSKVVTKEGVEEVEVNVDFIRTTDLQMSTEVVTKNDCGDILYHLRIPMVK
jgi:hypothetical protein